MIRLVSAVMILIVAGPAAIGQEEPQSEADRQRSAEISPDEQRMPLATPGAAIEADYEPLDLKGKRDNYFRSLFSPQVLMRQAAVAGIRQWSDQPEEWGSDGEAYAQRFASKFATSAIRRTIQFGFAVARHEDPRFERAAESGFRARTWHVLSRTVIVRRDDGTKTIAAGKLVGLVAASFISTTWHPDHDHRIRRGFRRTGVNLSSDLGYRMIREFWPDIRRVFRRGD